MPDASDGGRIDGRQVPPFHFGLVMEWTQWHAFRDHLKELDVAFRLKPHVRYPGSVGEQATMFVNDPSGNALEFKSFRMMTGCLLRFLVTNTLLAADASEPNAQG